MLALPNLLRDDVGAVRLIKTRQHTNVIGICTTFPCKRDYEHTRSRTLVERMKDEG
jgi:hypothetical protein